MDVDSLDIKISAEAKKANDAIDSIIRNLSRLSGALNIDTSKLGNIGKNLNFGEITNSAKTMSENVSRATAKVTESMKPIETQAKKIGRTFQELSEPYKDLGKGFAITGSTEDIQRKIDKLKNSLAEAKLKEEDLRLSGKTDLQGYDTAVKNVVKLENQIESLEKQLEKLNNTPVELQFDFSGLSDKDLDEMLGFPTIHRQAEEVAKSIDNVTESLRESGREFKNQWDGVKLPDLSVNKTDLSAMTELELDEWFKNLPSVKAQAEEVNESLSKISETAERVGEAVKGTWSGIQLPDFSTTQTDFIEDINAKIDALRQKFKDVGTDFVFKGNAEQLTKEIDRVSAELDKLYAKQDKMISLGKIDTSAFEALQYDISEASNRLEILQNTVAETEESVKKFSENLSKSRNAFKKLFSDTERYLQKINKTINSVLSKIGKLTKSMLRLGSATKDTNSGFNLSLKTILKYGFGIRSLYMLFNKFRNGVKDGMSNLIQYDERTNDSISTLKSSLNQLKTSLAAAFAPILNAIAPALNYLIQLLIEATNVINQFFTALFGGSSWTKAKYVYDDVAESIGGAAKAAKGALQPFDKLNNLTSQTGAGGGEILPEDMFEDQPINDKIRDFAEKVKNILSQLYAPLKEAWNREGDFVMKSWKYALDEVWKLIKDIGRDFLTVWQQEKTIKIFEDILRIIGDIGLAIGHLARNFREAWNENETGLKILQNIRDIIGVIIHNIRLAADATVDWADQLDFSPLLEAFKRFTASLVPVADALSGILTDFYTQVLLPLGKWTLEKGLPELLDVFTKFNEKVDWKSLRENLSEFWSHLEPFAETVGEGLILFIERVSDALANFLNSQEFKDFLTKVEQWMDKVTPEDVANGLEKIAKGIIKLKVGLAAWNILKAPLGILADFFKLISTFKLAKAIKNMGNASATGGLFSGLASSISGAVSSLGGLKGILTANLAELIPTLAGAGTAAEIGVVIGTGILGGLAGALGGGVLGKALDNYILAPLMSFDEELSEQYKNFKWFGEDGFFAQFKASFTDGSWKEALKLWGDDIYNGMVAIGESQAEWWTNIQTTWHTKLGEIRTSIIDTWNNIKTGISDKFKEIQTGISTKLNTIKTSWFTTWSTLKEKVTTIFNGITTTIGNAINSILTKINTLVQKIKGISGAAKSVLSTSVVGGGAGSALGGLVGIKSARSAGISTTSLYNYEIPTYATGGFPEDGWFRASRGEYFGQFDDGTSYIANNNQIETGIASGVEEAAYRGMMRALKESGGMGGSSSVSVTLEGEMANLFRAFQREYKSDAKRKGITSLDPVLG